MEKFTLVVIRLSIVSTFQNDSFSILFIIFQIMKFPLTFLVIVVMALLSSYHIGFAQSTNGRDTIYIFGARFAPGAKAIAKTGSRTDTLVTFRNSSQVLRAIIPSGYTQGTYKISVVNPAPRRDGELSARDLTIIPQDYVAVEYHYTTQELSYQQPQNPGVLSGFDSLWVLARAAPVSKSQKYDGFIFIDGSSTVTVEELQNETLSYIADSDVPPADDVPTPRTTKITSRYAAGQQLLQATMEISNTDGSQETQNITVSSYKTLVDSLKKSPITKNPMLVSQQMQMLKDNAVRDGLTVQSLGSDRWRIDVAANQFPSEIPGVNIPSGMTATLVINVNPSQNIMEATELKKNSELVSRTFYRKGGNGTLFPYDAIYTESYYKTPDNLAMKVINSTQYSNTSFLVKVKPAPATVR